MYAVDGWMGGYRNFLILKLMSMNANDVRVSFAPLNSE